MNATSEAQRLIADLLHLHGIRDAVLSPGSRSGPLALALAAADERGLIRLHVRVDEREAGFLALGLSKTSHRIVPVFTTSGTAVANLHPAMLEALHANVQLLAVTADRPARLRGTGANQTTEQRAIFPGIRFGESLAELVLDDRSPQHLNLELDEPLIEPVDWSFDPPEYEAVNGESAGAFVPELPVGPRTVVVAGDDAAQRARHLAEDGGWPLFAEPSSGSRNGNNALIAYRLLLANSPLADRIERVISFGHATLSRPVSRLLGRVDLEIIHLGTQATFPAPAGPNVRFEDDIAVAGRDDPVWLESWLEADHEATGAIDGLLDGTTPYDVARTVSAAVPPGGLLFIGSSNPIRDLDLVARPYTVGQRRLIIANRGLAGIDGTLSSAIGAALARDSSRSIAYVGDLTFLHGSNGLLIGPREPRPDLTIVVASDDGGSIFSTLEQGAPEYAGAFERVYATPTGASIGGVCSAYGIPHRQVGPQELAAALGEPTTGIRVIEVPIARDNRRSLAAAISDAVRSAVTIGLP